MPAAAPAAHGQMVLEGINAVVPPVFQTMAGLSAQPGAVLQPVHQPLVLQGVAGAIGLSGKVSGMVYMSFEKGLAVYIAEKILGSVSSDQDLSDVVAELTNMVTGNLKSRFSDNGYNCTLTPPSVVTGNKISVNPKNCTLSAGMEFLVDGCPEPLCVYFFGVFNQ